MSAAFQVKGSLFTISILQILTHDLTEIENQILIKTRQAPQFFHNTPMVVELLSLKENFDLSFVQALVTMLKEHSILPVGFRLPTPELTEALHKIGLPVFKEGKNIPASPTQPQKKVVTAKDTIIETRVRSGQQITAKGGDLIVLSSISPGAELISDGDIHVYGTLKGRAIAGAGGDTNARIFCQKLEADLVSIAGQYKIFDEAIKTTNNSLYQIYLQDGAIIVNNV